MSEFMRSYMEAFGTIEGMFSPDAAMLFFAYNQPLAEAGIQGDVLEIGVHHGLSTIATASMRGPKGRLIAIDLFDELQSLNVSKSGYGNKQRFLNNMGMFYPDVSFVQPLSINSADLTPADLGYGFSFCHVDGGHSATETFHDLDLSQQILVPGGLLALDDYFNPSFPGVNEGAIRFMIERPGVLTPVAIGYNKVLFQKNPVPFDLNARFAESFPQVPHATVTMWEQPTFLFASGVSVYFDLDKSAPNRLVAAQDIHIGADIMPERTDLVANKGQTVTVPVRVANRSSIPFSYGSTPFGLTYHLFAGDGSLIAYDNKRVYFTGNLQPGEEQTVELPIVSPDTSGDYQAELDIVWEGIAWLKDRGNPTSQVRLKVL